MTRNIKITGIVCEYNPFHNGHILHIKKTRELTEPDVLICVMSGNFVQRGEPAITNKWDRAATAIRHGVDLVVELPFIYATQSADAFAQGSIETLKLLKVDNIVFGSESNDIKKLEELLLIDDDISSLKAEGISSAMAYERLYGGLHPNDILGLNYVKHARNNDIEAYTIQRTNSYHNQNMEGSISSATAIRNQIYKHEDYEYGTPMKDLNDSFKMEHYYPYIKMLLLTTPAKELKKSFLMDEGIENNLIKNCKIADAYEEFLNLCISKRYTKSSIQRTLVHLMNHTYKNDADFLPELNHVRILAFNQKGKDYLHTLKEDIIIASKFNQIPSPYREMELKATQVYAYPLSVAKQKEMAATELQPPRYIKD